MTTLAPAAKLSAWSRPNSWITGLTITALYGAAFWALLLIRPWPHAVMLRIDDTADVAGTLVGVGIAVGFFWRHRRGSTIESVQSARTRWAPVLLGGGLLFYAGGSVLWYVYQIVLKQPPFPSWADAFYLV
ncbi:MAG TPA: hypothetical protein VG815_16360, partial [Chloroflexota bacterium]|nr:hypothetical protein [Chloroflexota bacterium]